MALLDVIKPLTGDFKPCGLGDECTCVLAQHALSFIVFLGS